MQTQYSKRRDMLAGHRATVIPTLNGYPAVVCGLKNDFATVATINGPAMNAEFAWSTVERVLQSGGQFKI